MPYKNKEDAATNKRQWRAANPEKAKKHQEKQSQAAKAHYRAHRDTMSARKRQYRYGVSAERFDEMLKSQNSSCAICETLEPGGHGAFHVDHCHSSGVVRGLLCHRCNLGLGQFRDDTALLQNAIGYLNDH